MPRLGKHQLWKWVIVRVALSLHARMVAVPKPNLFRNCDQVCDLLGAQTVHLDHELILFGRSVDLAAGGHNLVRVVDALLERLDGDRGR